MKVTFLGTGTSQGVPVITCQCKVCRSVDFRDKRLRTSVLFQIGEINIVIDSGPDFRQQMLRQDLQHLDALLFTHEHKDHTAGLDDIRAFNFKSGNDLPVYATEQVFDQLTQEFYYIFDESYNYPGVPRVKPVVIENKPFDVKGIEVIPIQVMHYKLPVFGYRIGDVAYVTDANFISAKEKKKLKGLKVLVINALRTEKHISHFNLEEALELIKELKPEQAYLTHISHYLGRHEDVSGQLPENVSIAYDDLSFEA